MLLSDEKKKTKSIDSEVNPVWNEVSTFCSNRVFVLGKVVLPKQD